MSELKSMIEIYFDLGLFNKVEVLKDINCIICEKTLKDTNNAVKTKCKHYFHSNCLDKWFTETNKNKILKGDSICPQCANKLD